MFIPATNNHINSSINYAISIYFSFKQGAPSAGIVHWRNIIRRRSRNFSKPQGRRGQGRMERPRRVVAVPARAGPGGVAAGAGGAASSGAPGTLGTTATAAAAAAAAR